jgi:hypothetical protein
MTGSANAASGALSSYGRDGDLPGDRLTAYRSGACRSYRDEERRDIGVGAWPDDLAGSYCVRDGNT